jgi:hypothetical protein
MKRMQIVFTNEAWSVVETTLAKATENFDTGSISTSDAVNELILHARIDIKALQTKHIGRRRRSRRCLDRAGDAARKRSLA